MYWIFRYFDISARRHRLRLSNGELQKLLDDDLLLLQVFDLVNECPDRLLGLWVELLPLVQEEEHQIGPFAASGKLLSGVVHAINEIFDHGERPTFKALNIERPTFKAHSICHFLTASCDNFQLF